MIQLSVCEEPENALGITTLKLHIAFIEENVF